MEKLKLQELLRYAFSGALFYVTLILVYVSKTAIFSGGLSAGLVATALGTVLLSGSLLYTLHRATTYPFLFYPFSLFILSIFGVYRFEWKMLTPFSQSQTELNIEDFRFDLNSVVSQR